MSTIATTQQEMVKKQRATIESKILQIPVMPPVQVKSVTLEPSPSPSSSSKPAIPLRLSNLRESPFSVLLPTKGLTAGSDELCMHFVKHGTCKHEDTCRFVHDSGRVQLCRAYLRGDCVRGDKCPLSHDRDPDRQPQCGMFLKAACFDSNCRFLNIKKSSSAEECADFVNSYCSRGKYCPYLHYVPAGVKRKAEEAVDSEEELVNEEAEFEKAWSRGKELKMFT